MDPVDRTPTEAADYAALSVIYSSLLAALALSAREREPIPTAELVPLSAATFALSKLIVHEKVETWLRQPFLEEDSGGRRPRGRRLRFAVGELLNCTRCMGAWTALGLVGLRMHSPAAGRAATTVLAASAGSDVLHSAFSLLCARATDAQEARQPRPLSAARQAP